MAPSEIDAIRTLLGSKPRPVGWSERRQRLDEVGSTWPVASDVQCEAVDCDGVAGEWSIVPGSEPSRVLLYFHGGGYCSGSVSHRRLVTEAGRAAHTRTLAIDIGLPLNIPTPPPMKTRSRRGASCASRALRRQVLLWRRQRRRQPDARADQPAARCRRGIARLRLADFTVDRSHHVRQHARDQGRRRSANSQGLSRRACGCLCDAVHRSPRSADPPCSPISRAFRRS